MRVLSNNPFCQMRRQKGAVLITGLIFLIILTMIVLSVLSSGTLEERMAANDRNRQVGLQAAEAVLRDAETSLLKAAPFDPFDATQFTNTCTNGFCSTPTSNTEPRWKTVSWNSLSTTRTFSTTSSQLVDLPSQPRYIVEIMSAPYRPNAAVARCEPGVVNITSRGVGRDNAEVFILSTYRFLPSSC